MKDETTDLDYWLVDNRKILKYSSAYQKKLMTIMKNAIFDNNIHVYEARKLTEGYSNYYLFSGKGTAYYTVVRVSSHKPYSSYYSYRSFFPFGFQKSENFSKNVRDYLYGLGWDVLSYEEYFYLQMLMHGGMAIYVLGGKKKFGARWHPDGPLEFFVKDEYTNTNYPANEMLTRAFRKMVSNGLLGHQVIKGKLRLVVSHIAKTIVRETKPLYHSLWMRERSMIMWDDIKPFFEFDKSTLPKHWIPPQVYFSGHKMNKNGEISSLKVEPNLNITSLIIDSPKKNEALETYDMLHRIRIYRRKRLVIYQIIKKGVGIVSEMEYPVERKTIETFFNILIHDVKMDLWPPSSIHKKESSIIKVRHSDLHMNKFEVDMQTETDLQNLKERILDLVDFDGVSISF
ncbi:hypothetical protein [Enterococcus sp. AZ196]|uniref:hypothetical protein n=1 Tax=Enterococcus sp. AZ196 TaxID=2774659 RepID=UPI003D26B54C